MIEQVNKSSKSYGVAVALCGIFGVFGIHHFYLKDYLHGLADISLLVLTFLFFVQGFMLLGIITLLLDAVHTIVVFYLLIVEQWRDGDGYLVTMS